MRIFLAAPDIFPGDAVGNHCLSIIRCARRLGWPAQAYAERYSGEVRSIEALFNDFRTNDILIVSYSIYDPHLDRLLALKGPKLCYFHGVTPANLLVDFEPATAELCYRSISQYPQFKKFNTIIANSKSTAKTLSEYFPIESIKIIPPVFADMPIFGYNPIRIKKTTKEIRLLVVGRVVPHKCLEDAIEILGLLRHQYEVDARLCIVGNESNNTYSKHLRQIAQSLDIEDFIEFRGMVSDDDLLGFYLGSTAFLSVSRHEGFCIPVLEAMHLGLPVFVKVGTAACEVCSSAGVAFTDVRQAAIFIHQVTSDPCRMAKHKESGKSRSAELLGMAKDKEWERIFCSLNLNRITN